MKKWHQECHKSNFEHAPQTIDYLMEWEVAIMLCFQLCFARYTVLQTKNNMRSISAINPVITESMDYKHNSRHSHREAASCYHELTPCIVSEKNWNTKKD